MGNRGIDSRSSRRTDAPHAGEERSAVWGQSGRFGSNAPARAPGTYLDFRKWSSRLATKAVSMSRASWRAFAFLGNLSVLHHRARASASHGRHCRLFPAASSRKRTRNYRITRLDCVSGRCAYNRRLAEFAPRVEGWAPSFFGIAPTRCPSLTRVKQRTGKRRGGWSRFVGRWGGRPSASGSRRGADRETKTPTW